MQGQGPCNIMRIVVDGACNFWTAWVQRASENSWNNKDRRFFCAARSAAAGVRLE